MRPLPLLCWGLFAVAVVAVYAPVVAELARDWLRDPNYSHGILIPVISLFLVWRQRQKLADLPRRSVPLGLAGVIVAAALFVFGAAGAEVFTQRVSLVLFGLSAVVFLLGWAWFRRLWFPIALLLLAIPLPYVIYYSLTSPMQALAAKCAVVGLNGVGVPVVAEGNILHLPNTSLEVAEACSGIRSLYSFLALGALMAYSMNIPLLGRLLVFLATIPVSIVANAFRVWSSSLGAYFFGPEVTEGWIHETFGLLVFVLALGVFLIVRKGAKSLWRSVP